MTIPRIKTSVSASSILYLYQVKVVSVKKEYLRFWYPKPGCIVSCTVPLLV